MTESGAAPGVAVLSSDAELGAHLREALIERGAHIVHEGPLDGVDPEVLVQSGAEVVVVNLARAGDEHLDALCAALEQGPQRVVFNEAEASQHLSGWDRARWARHLAAKVLGADDVDPPRPAAATGVAAAGGPVDEVPGRGVGLDVEGENRDVASGAAAAAADGKRSDDGPGATDPMDPGLPSAAVDVERRQTESLPAPSVDWELVDFDAASPAPVEREDPARFGIEKVDKIASLQAGDEVDASPDGADFELELVSLEEPGLASRVDVTVSEMMLDDGIGSIRRVVLVGVGREATGELGQFLAALPATLAALVLVVQHDQERDADGLSAALEHAPALPLELARDGSTAHPGEIRLVPVDCQCRVRRDGHMTLVQGGAGTAAGVIDRNLQALAGTFGSDITAIVLAGAGGDGFAGAQAVVGRGGRVGVVDPAEPAGGMAAAIDAHGLADFRGTAAELAAHVAEVHA